MQPKGETDHCRYRLLKYCKGQGLDLGCGNVKIKTDAIGVDLYSPVAEMHRDARDLSCYKDGYFDYVYSSHLLEEFESTEYALREWLRVLKDDGYLVLYQPDEEYYYKLGDPRCNRAHKKHFTWEGLWAILENIGGVELVHKGRYNPEVHKEWSFELVVRKGQGKDIEKSEDLKFKVMVVAGPAENYIERCLESLCIQDYSNWEAQVVLDPIGDKTYEKALKFQSDRIKIKLNDSQQYNVANFLEASRLLNPSDNDVLIVLDGDDWLAGPSVLSILKSYYDKNSDLLVTHGSWEAFPGPAPNNNRPYTESDFKKGVRKVGWRGSHLRTCKYKVWKHLKDKDLRNKNGNYFNVTGDLAMTYPLLEMAGYGRVQFIPEVLYIYNQETPFGDERAKFSEQKDTEKYIKNMTPYPCLEHFMFNINIFSKDRACQLDLLLRSIKEFWEDYKDYKISILYKSSTDEYKRAYDSVISEYPEFNFVEEKDFKEDIYQLINPDADYTMFFVDDQIFKESFKFKTPEFESLKTNEDIMAVSLRLYPGIKKCYPMGNIDTPPPVFGKELIWKWSDFTGDWSYPWSVDGNIFRTKDLIEVIRSKRFTNPNNFEDALKSQMVQRPFMVCSPKSKVINNPCNKVGEYPNIHGDIACEYLNTEFLNGKRLSMKSIKGMEPISCHQEFDYTWL